MSELKPCPFCGSKNVVLLPKDHYLVGRGVKFKDALAIVQCMTCFSAAGFFSVKKLGEEEAKKKAAELWNRRAE